jgi:choloylglycine hydrolase
MRSWLLVALLLCQKGEGCTAFELSSSDGGFVYARSMEFEYQMNSDILIVPRAQRFSCSFDQKTSGMSYSTRFGFIGLNQSLAPSFVNDGMNEKGLVVGALYLPHVAQYPKLNIAKRQKTLAPWELPNYILGTCACIQDVRVRIKDLVVANISVPGYKDFVVPLHFWISDSSGQAIVVEYIQGELQISDNPVGVMTNSPQFSWHLLNLSNYCKMTPQSPSGLSFGNLSVAPISQGAGLSGLPGDYTSVSRFVKAAVFKQFAAPAKSAFEAVQTGFHILNTFDIFQGLIVDPSDPSHPPLAETTQWVVVHDKLNLTSFFRTYGGQKIQTLDFRKIDFNAKELKVIKLAQGFDPQEISNNVQPLN